MTDIEQNRVGLVLSRVGSESRRGGPKQNGAEQGGGLNPWQGKSHKQNLEMERTTTQHGVVNHENKFLNDLVVLGEDWRRYSSSVSLDDDVVH